MSVYLKKENNNHFSALIFLVTTHATKFSKTENKEKKKSQGVLSMIWKFVSNSLIEQMLGFKVRKSDLSFMKGGAQM